MAFLKNCWYVAAHQGEVGREPLARTILNEKLMMFRGEDGDGHALGNVCPHRFAFLSKGKLFGDVIECPYHGLRFDTTGTCVHNPHGDGTIPPHARVQSYPFVERYGVFWIWMGDPAKADSEIIPDFSPLVHEGFAPVHGYLQIEANYQLIVDNLMDLSHIEFLHPALSTPDWIAKRRSDVRQEPGVVHCTNRAEDVKIMTLDRMIKPDALPIGEQWLDLRWAAPSNVFLDVRYLTPNEQIIHPIGHFMTPESESRTHYFFRWVRNHDVHNEELSRSIATILQEAFMNEDGPIIEDQQINLGDVDVLLAKPVILKSDTAAIRVRRMLSHMIADEARAEY